MINEHDMTKKMLSRIREATTPQQPESDTIEPSPEELAAEQAKFCDIVYGRAEFTTFQIYPQAGNAIFGGKIDNLEWQFSLEERDGCYITTSNLVLTDEMVNTIQKLKGYYGNWSEEWQKKVQTEYRNARNS